MNDEGQVSARADATLALSVVEDYATRLPGAYRWCRRLSGSITTTTRSDEEDLDFVPVCTDGIGRGIIHDSGAGPLVATIQSILTDSGTHVLHLGSTAG
jgi:hypothetical protein